MTKQDKFNTFVSYGILEALLFTLVFMSSIIPIFIITTILFKLNIYEIAVSVAFFFSIIMAVLITLYDKRNIGPNQENYQSLA